ncbi:MAG: helix-hairpin-helix domain-containing protein [Candidatus Omnitrophota bacterium]
MDRAKYTLMTKHEMVFVAVLSAFLLIGAFVLYYKHTRPVPEITIVKGGVKEQLTLKQVEENLKEARRVDINKATASELQVIPGVGEVLASKIVEYRSSRGDFEYETDLLNVEGIGEKKLEKIREYIKIEP